MKQNLETTWNEILLLCNASTYKQTLSHCFTPSRIQCSCAPEIETIDTLLSFAPPISLCLTLLNKFWRLGLSLNLTEFLPQTLVSKLSSWTESISASDYLSHKSWPRLRSSTSSWTLGPWKQLLSFWSELRSLSKASSNSNSLQRQSRNCLSHQCINLQSQQRTSPSSWHEASRCAGKILRSKHWENRHSRPLLMMTRWRWT